jgi:hypothetical protein
MKFHTKIILSTVTLLMALGLAACGGSAAVTVNDLPVYPGAVALQEGESALADTLANNGQTDAALRSQIGIGGSVEQKGFRLPENAKWDDVKAFYDKELKAQGWGTNSLVSGILEQANQGNDLFQTTNWQKGKQNVTLVMVASPVDPSEKELIISLATQ